MSIRFDGIYGSIIPTENPREPRTYFRFLADGLVLKSSERQDVLPSDALKNLRRRRAPYVATWNVVEQTIRFVTHSSYGRVSFEASFEEQDRLRLKSENHASGRSNTRTLEFHQMSPAQLRGDSEEEGLALRAQLSMNELTREVLEAGAAMGDAAAQLALCPAPTLSATAARLATLGSPACVMAAVVSSWDHHDKLFEAVSGNYTSPKDCSIGKLVSAAVAWTRGPTPKKLEKMELLSAEIFENQDDVLNAAVGDIIALAKDGNTESRKVRLENYWARFLKEESPHILLQKLSVFVSPWLRDPKSTPY